MEKYKNNSEQIDEYNLKAKKPQIVRWKLNIMIKLNQVLKADKRSNTNVGFRKERHIKVAGKSSGKM